MGKMKKLVILLSITVLAFGYSFASFLAIPESALAADDETAKTEAVAGGIEQSASSSVGPTTVCEEPTGGLVYDGEIIGQDAAYFNNASEIAANWSGFNDQGNAIIKFRYSVWRKVSGSPAVKIIDWTKTTNNHFENGIDPSPIEGAKYFTKVEAKNICGWSDIAKSDGEILDTVAPITNYFALQQNKPYGGIIHLVWVPASDANGIKNYQIYRNGLLYDTVNGATTSYNDVISGDNVVFSYYLKAVDLAGNISDPSNGQQAAVDDVAPAAPSISYFIGGGNIVIFWPVVSGATNYEVYRGGTLIHSGSETKFTDVHPTKGMTHNYVVYAFDEAGNKSGPSNTLSIYVPQPTVSSAATSGQVQGTSTGTTQGETQVSPSPSPSPSGEVKASESSVPAEEGTNKTNWSLIIAIIIAAAIVVAGVLYWWYAREDEDEI